MVGKGAHLDVSVLVGKIIAICISVYMYCQSIHLYPLPNTDRSLQVLLLFNVFFARRESLNAGFPFITRCSSFSSFSARTQFLPAG